MHSPGLSSYRLRVVAVLWLAMLAACSQQEQSALPEPAPAVAPAVSTAIVYVGARIIVGDGSPAIENATFVVDGGDFVEVGPAGAVAVPPGATRVDLAGATVMPTLIDTHVHLSRERDALIEDLRRRAVFGVSAAMSLGQDEGEAVYQVRAESMPGIALYRTAGRGITAPEPGRTEIPHWITNVDEARAAVQAEAALGVDIIKIWVDDRDGQYAKLTPELYRAVIDEAHTNNLRVVAHLFTLEDAKGLVAAGVDAFAHGVRDMDVDDEFIALVKARPDFVLGPNLPARGVATDIAWLQGKVSDEQFAQLQGQSSTDNAEAQAFFAIQARNLARMSAEGVTIVLGTDGNTPWGPHIEMEDMVAAGMTPADVIRAATANGAAYLGLEGRGTISAGKRADFIVLEANPLDDITNTRQIRAVYLAGVAVGN